MQVIFKKDRHTKEIIAFLPEVPVNRGMIMSYMHTGQHSEATIAYYRSTLRTEYKEYSDLYDELCDIYQEQLRVKKRLNYNLLMESWR